MWLISTNTRPAWVAVGLAIFALKEKEILEAKSGEDLMKILSGKLLLDVAETLKVLSLTVPLSHKLNSCIFFLSWLM